MAQPGGNQDSKGMPLVQSQSGTSERLDSSVGASVGGRLSRLIPDTCGDGDGAWNTPTSLIIDGVFIGEAGETDGPPTIHGRDKNNDDENNNGPSRRPGKTNGGKFGDGTAGRGGKASRIPIRKGRRRVGVDKEAEGPKTSRSRKNVPKAGPGGRVRPCNGKDDKVIWKASRKSEEDGSSPKKSSCPEDGCEMFTQELAAAGRDDATAATAAPDVEWLIIEAPAQFLDHHGRPRRGQEGGGGRPAEAAPPTATGAEDSVVSDRTPTSIAEDCIHHSTEIFEGYGRLSNSSSPESSSSIDSELASMNLSEIETIESHQGFPKPAKRLSLLSPNRLTPVEFDRKSPEASPRSVNDKSGKIQHGESDDGCKTLNNSILDTSESDLDVLKAILKLKDLPDENYNIKSYSTSNDNDVQSNKEVQNVENTDNGDDKFESRSNSSDSVLNFVEEFSNLEASTTSSTMRDIIDGDSFGGDLKISQEHILDKIEDYNNSINSDSNGFGMIFGSPKSKESIDTVFDSVSSTDNTAMIAKIDTNSMEVGEVNSDDKIDLTGVSSDYKRSESVESSVEQETGEVGSDFQVDNMFATKKLDLEVSDEQPGDEVARRGRGRGGGGAPPSIGAAPRRRPPSPDAASAAADGGSRCEPGGGGDSAAAADGRTARARPHGGGGGGGLRWRFRPDGRLVFDEGDGGAGGLTSRHINKRCDSSRLRALEDKLKEAGIADSRPQEPAADAAPAPKKPNNAYDANRNAVASSSSSSDDEEDLLPDLGGDDAACEFDASCFARPADDDGDDSDDGYVIVRRPGAMRDTDNAAKHNPDKDNLRSLLKKPGGGRQREKKSNRVVFNETKNEFFDADYIILIREECCAEFEDEDDDDCDEPCTCHRPEMVRLPCCEPGCGCGEPQQPQPPSPKFAPPPEFVDAVALSPPEGYKDMEGLERRGGGAGGGSGGAAVCRECSQSHAAEEEEDEGSPSDTEQECRCEDIGEREKTDQSQQTTPTTPPEEDAPGGRGYGGADMPTGATQLPPPSGSPVTGILKGGRLWRQQTVEAAQQRASEPPQAQSSDSAPSDDDCCPNGRRSVRFTEASEAAAAAARTRDECDGAPGSPPAEPPAGVVAPPAAGAKTEAGAAASPDSTEMTLTFRLGHHVLITNNSLKPNSAVRQLFPGAKVDAAEQQQYLVTAESLRAFEEAKRAKLPQLLQGEADESIRRAIERNALRRSLIRYEARGRKQPYKADNSLVERIKQLTCDVDNDVADGNDSKESSTDAGEDLPDSRASPPGEEARNSPEVHQLINKNQDKSFSPSSSSTTSSSSMSSSSTLNRNRPDNLPDIQNNIRREKPSTLPDIGGPHHNHPMSMAAQPDLAAAVVSRAGSTSSVDGPRRQFLQATLAPLTACVGVGVGVAGAGEEYYYQLSGQAYQGDRASLASSGGGTDYSLEDIDEALREAERRPAAATAAPDVVAGTPAAPEPPRPIAAGGDAGHAPPTATAANDELAAFVKRDAGRIERIRKKYQPEVNAGAARTPTSAAAAADDEHDDYGFSRRPSVRGIKPRFGTTTEILQQIQDQLQQPAQQQQQQQQQQRPAAAAWPYYSDQQPDNAKRGANQNYAYRPPPLPVEEGLYQNCVGQGCVREVYRSNVNTYSTVVRVGCNDYYQSLPRQRSGRPQSPPPTDVSRQYHQTMVYIPYDRIEGYQPALPPGTAPVPYYHAADYARVANQNQINKRYVSTPGYGPPGRPPPYPDGQPPPPHHHPPSRGGSPLPGQLATARGTQTPAPPLPPPATNCAYYQTTPRYRPMVGPAWPSDGGYVTKVNRHSFPVALARYPGSDSASLTDSDSQHSGQQLLNGYRQSADLSHYQKEHAYQRDSAPGSPTKPRFIERGVPEGAASVSPQDGVGQTTSGTMTSPTSPQNPPGQKPLFYAMNV